MKCDKVSLVDVVRALDRLVAKTQVAYGDTAGLFGVILEICLNILIGMVAYDLYGVLIRTDGTVAAETPELTFLGALRSGIRSRLFLERQMSDIVVDAEGEVSLGSVLGKLVINCEYACGRSIL